MVLNANATVTVTAIAIATAAAAAIAIAIAIATGNAARWAGLARRSHAPGGRRSQMSFGLHTLRFAPVIRFRLHPHCGEGIRKNDGGGLVRC